MDGQIIPSREELNESVDDILDDILGKNGGFNESFTELYSKYLGGDGSRINDLLSVDLSDRSDENRVRPQVEYEDPDLVPRPIINTTKRVTDRLPESMREVYTAAERQVQRPEFTSGGEVKYPSMGIGEAEERVVFDADWEQRAKQEAAKREELRRDNMLRGDSTYARTFITRGDGGDGTGRRIAVNPAYIDPLTDDDIRRFEKPDDTLSKKRAQSLEETFGKASDEKSKKGLFKKKK